MDNKVSPSSITTSASPRRSNTTPPSSASRQPKYTTAGTLYNPRSSQPLQPPTRRSRAKWVTPGTVSELTHLPRAASCSVPTGPASSFGSGYNGRAPARQQYMPLQQNYHRAANPLLDTEYFVDGMADNGASRMSDHNGFHPDAKDEPHDTGNGDVDDYNEELTTNDPLFGLSVQSIHNLASYPNPSQKKAQQALQLAPKPHFGKSIGLARDEASPPSPSSQKNEIRHKSDNGFKPTSVLRSRRSEPGATERFQIDGASFIEASQTSTFWHERNDRFRGDVIQDNRKYSIGPTALASGPGAPRPLTAGPPGLRQYRAPARDNDYKSLNTEDFFEPSGYSYTQTSAQSSERRDFEGAAPYGSGNQMHGLSAPGGHTVSFPGDETVASFHGNSFNADIAGFPPASVPHQTRASYATMNASFCNNSTPCPLNGADTLHPHFPTPEELLARRERINCHWYAGSDLLWGSMESHQRRFERSKFGVIGQGRPSKKDANTPDERPRLDIGQAIRKPVSEHAEPLLNMAFGSLLRISRETDSDDPFGQFERQSSCSEESDAADLNATQDDHLEVGKLKANGGR